MFENRFERIKVKVTGSHYQPNGCDEAFVAGVSWDKDEKRPCVHLLYETGEEDSIPLSELGSSHILGSVTILNPITNHTNGQEKLG